MTPDKRRAEVGTLLRLVTAARLATSYAIDRLRRVANKTGVDDPLIMGLVLVRQHVKQAEEQLQNLARWEAK